jgi:N-acetyl-anhydromuramyl-L-alanine amidase AmpD
MNSYSIGIEMCHVGGQDYPAAQLRAVDRLIAAIDRTYGGYAGKIIDHKTWRPGNSDTDANFAKYLKNYQKYRKHAK